MACDAPHAGCQKHLSSNTETTNVSLGMVNLTKKPCQSHCSTENQCCQERESADTLTAATPNTSNRCVCIEREEA